MAKHDSDIGIQGMGTVRIEDIDMVGEKKHPNENQESKGDVHHSRDFLVVMEQNTPVNVLGIIIGVGLEVRIQEQVFQERIEIGANVEEIDKINNDVNNLEDVKSVLSNEDIKLRNEVVDDDDDLNVVDNKLEENQSNFIFEALVRIDPYNKRKVNLNDTCVVIQPIKVDEDNFNAL